jgi:integrase
VSPRETITLGRAISLWEGSLRARVKAEKTIKSYIRSVEYLEDAYGRDADPKTITTEDVEFVMAKWRGKSPTTVRNRLVAIREFFKWGGKRFGWADPTMAIDIPPRDEPAYRRLTVGEVTSILDVQVSERYHLYVSLLAYTAARIDALRTTTWGDVDLVGGKIVFPHHRAKGRRGHEIPIAEPLLEDLARSKDLRGDDAFDEAYLIPARRRAQFIPEEEAILWDQPASQMSLGRMLKAVAAAAAVRAPNQITAHMFRRYTLEHIVDDYGLYVGAALAGHRSIQTTAMYGGGASRGKVAEALAQTRLRNNVGVNMPQSSSGRTWDRTKASRPVDAQADGGEPAAELVTPEDAS